MAIFRGVGGSGDSSDNSFLQEVTAQANAAEASATSAANSLTALQNTSIIELSELQTITSQSNLNLKFNSNGSQSKSLLKIFNNNTASTALEVNSLGSVGIGGSVSGYSAEPRDDNTLSIGTMAVGITASEAVVGIKGETGKPHIALQAPDSGETTAITLTDTHAFVIAKGISGLLGLTTSGNLNVSGTVEGRDVAYDGSKLDTIEAGATADQTDAEIKTAYENNADTNVFTDADHTKLNGIEASATADQTGAEIKTAYEAEADTNAYTDAEKTKLSGIETSATADQTDAEIKTAYENNADTNVFTDAEKTKLSGIEASADVTDTANVTAAGALMDSEVTNLAQVKAFDSSDYLTTHQDISGKANLSGATFTGTITAPNVDISTTGSVTTNIATGANNSNTTDVKVVNIGTGYGNGFYSGLSTTINMGSQSSNAKNIFNIGNGTTSGTGENTINLKGNVNVDGSVGELDATVTAPSQNTPILKLRKNSASANGTGRFIILNSTTTSGGSELTRGIIGLSNTSSPQFSNPYMSHTSGSNGILCSYSGSSSFNAIAPCASTGLTSNGSLNLGHAYAKWNTVYASSGSINTSDITKKQDIEELSEAENRVAIAAKGLLRKYRWKESVVEKGDNARIHFGIMAQDLKAAFEAEGLDANKYGMFCADTRWTTDGTDTYATEEEAPEAVTEETVYGVRYEELLAFIIAAI